MKVRTRFAPSPTGSLHIGGMRTALYSYAWAKKHGGQFILRIEDTDRTRFVDGSMEEIFEMFTAYGLIPDESLQHGGDFGPYLQSERLDIYKKYAQQLVEQGDAYYCFLTEEETVALQEECRKQNKKLRSPYRNGDLVEAQVRIAKGEPYTIRQKLPENEIVTFTDGVQGKIEVETNELDEGVLLKTDGYPTYHLAVVIDDHLMEITHILRSSEWLPSTPKHILLFKSFGWDAPEILHPTALLDPNGGKLSKRYGSVAAQEFLKEGYLPEAMLNFLMLLGWSSPEERSHGEAEREIFSLSEFVELFDLKDLNKSNPIFNREKLLWFNQQYILGLGLEELAKRFVAWLEQFALGGENDLLAKQIVAEFEQAELLPKLELLQPRVKTLWELLENITFFYQPVGKIDWNIKQLSSVQGLVDEVVAELRKLFADMPANSSDWSHPDWEMGMRAIADKYEIKHGDCFMILRVAITGGPFSPPLFESLQVLGKEEVLARLDL